MNLNRRNFMFLAGGAVGGAAAGGVTLKGISRLNEALAPPMGAYPGEEKLLTSICRDCSGGCGLQVRTVGGRVVKLDGNVNYPTNRRGLCPGGQALTQALYHPDRVLSPRKRTRVDEAWQQTSWEGALGLVADALKRTPKSDRARQVMIVSGRNAGIAQEILGRFVSAFGGAQYFQLPEGTEVSTQALQWMSGGLAGANATRVAYDLENSRCVLSFGCDLFQGWGTPGYTLRVLGNWRAADRERMTSLIHFGPRFSVSAARADEWVPTREGTWGAAALGLAYVLISEDLYDHDFVDESTFGFEDWTDSAGVHHVGFRNLVREKYRLSQASEITGIPTEVFVRVAREFAAGPGGVAIGPQQSPAQPGRLSEAMAVHALNALVGSIGAQGGVKLMPQQGWSLPEGQDQKPDRSFDHLLAALNSAPQILILDHAARLEDWLTSSQLAKLRQIPLVVTNAEREDSTTQWARLHLPDCTSLESWSDGQSPSIYPLDLLSVSAPVLPPLGDSRPWVETLLALARLAGPEPAAALPWKTSEEVLRAAATEVATRKRGYLFGIDVDEQWQRLLERSGWWQPDWSAPEQFWDSLVEKGGWWDPLDWSAEPQRSFLTASKKFEFYPQQLEAFLRQQPAMKEAANSAERDRLILPHHNELFATEGEKETLLLEPYDLLSFYGGRGTDIPYLQQLSSQLEDHQWRSWVEISEHDAEERGIHVGDTVWIESATGKIRRRALIVEASRPGVVHVPFGGSPSTGTWKTSEDRLADVLIPIADAILRTRCSLATRVKIYKA